MNNNFDIAIIGAGVCGCAIARELSRYQASICVLEKSEDVCCGTSKANSGIVHAGFDAQTGSLKAKLNLQGCFMMPKLCKDLDIPYINNGSLVCCTDKSQMSDLEKLLQRGIDNGVKELRILDAQELRSLEPNISDDVYAALYAPGAGIVDPFMLTIALAENANVNGVEFKFNNKVTNLDFEDSQWKIKTNQGAVYAKYVVNAAGVFADQIHNMVSQNKYEITPRRGNYFLLDKTSGCHVKSTIFMLPNEFGKGVLVAPTCHGNLLVGPTAVDVEDKEAVNTSSDELNFIRNQASMTVKNIDYRDVITSFAGLRAHDKNDDFIIEQVKDAQNFIDVYGIESPGLTSAPAIGCMVADILKNKINLSKKNEFKDTRKGILNPADLTEDERCNLINNKPEYGQIICRCESISEGEIVDAITRPLGSSSLDGIKRRVRAGMGRCQAGFCSPRVMELLAKHTGKSISEITKCGGESQILKGINKEDI